MRRYYPQLMIVLLLGVLTFLVFGQTLTADFVQWDDDINLYRNTQLGPPSLERLAWMFGDLHYQWRYQPLSWLTWSVVYQFSGLNPFGYHLANLILHALNGICVYVIVRKLLGLTLPQSRSTRVDVCAALGAILWLVHPLRVEFVAWATELLYCQATFFALLALLFYLRSHDPNRLSGGRGAYWAAVAAFACSLLSFPLAFGFVSVLLVVDVYPLRRFPPGPDRWWNGAARRVWLEKVPFVALTAAALAVNLYCRTHTAGTWSRPVPLSEFGLVPRMMQAFYLWAYYAWKPWVPFELSPVYTQLVRFQPSDWPFVLSAVAVVAVTATLFALRRRWPAGLAVWLIHLALLVPMLGLTEHPHYPGDRYSSMAAVPWSILLGGGLLKLWSNNRWRVPALMAALALVGGLALLSVWQVRVWQNSVTLFTHAIQKLGRDPYRADLQYRLGKVYLDQQQYPRAVDAINEALTVRPESPIAHFHLAQALLHLGRTDEALAHARETLRFSPAFDGGNNLVGVIDAQKGRLEAAVSAFNAELAVRPEQSVARMNRALALAKLGNIEPALADFTEAMRLAPDEFGSGLQGRFLQSLAAAYFKAGREPEAARMARKAAALAEEANLKELAGTIRAEMRLYESAPRR